MTTGSAELKDRNRNLGSSDDIRSSTYCILGNSLEISCKLFDDDELYRRCVEMLTGTLYKIHLSRSVQN